MSKKPLPSFGGNQVKPYERIKDYPAERFVRLVGLGLTAFNEIVGRVRDYLSAERTAKPLTRRGLKSGLSLEDRVLLNFYYKRHYPTYDNLGHIFEISESYANKVYHRMDRILFKVLAMPDPAALLNPATEAVIIDATEQPIERPQCGQKSYFSGKKNHHTFKALIIICLKTLEILAVLCRKGAVHDFTVLKDAKIAIHPDIEKKMDAGFQGAQKRYKNTTLPIKKSKLKPLTQADKKHNRALARIRIRVEHVNRRCKIFRIVKEVYRGKHKNIGKNWNAIAAIVNLRYAKS